jgi:hypothetical protein
LTLTDKVVGIASIVFAIISIFANLYNEVKTPGNIILVEVILFGLSALTSLFPRALWSANMAALTFRHSNSDALEPSLAFHLRRKVSSVLLLVLGVVLLVFGIGAIAG